MWNIEHNSFNPPLWGEIKGGWKEGSMDQKSEKLLQSLKSKKVGVFCDEAGELIWLNCKIC